MEARIPWAAVLKFASNERSEQLASKLGPVIPGFRFGCGPMLIEVNCKQQSFIGGAQHRKPTGRDANSRDIVLRDKP